MRYWHLRLYRAALDGNWGGATNIFENTSTGITARDRITKQGDTILHVAAAANRTLFVKRLVMEGYVKAKDLAIKNFVGNTALHYAASSGNLELVEFMIKRNKNLVLIRGKDDMLPLHIAALSGREEIVNYLYPLSNLNNLNNEDKIELLVALINSDLYDVAWGLLLCYEELAVCRDRNGETALHALARKSTASSKLTKQDQDLSMPWLIKFIVDYVEWFLMIKLYSPTYVEYNKKLPYVAMLLIENIWERVMLLDDHKIAELIEKPWPLLFVIAERGNFEFLKKLIDEYPDITHEVDNNGYSIFHIAVLNRHWNIFKLIYDTGPYKDTIVSTRDKQGNTILHLAGMLAPPNRLKIVPGAALQMQREVLWFKKVSNIMRPSDAEAVNNEGKTPTDLFFESHKDLKAESEKWMKDTANSCMVVATLVAIVVSAAAFTVPEGNKEDTGAPNFFTDVSFKILAISGGNKEDTGVSKEVSYKVFAISEAVSLIFASISILSFLSILTFNYEKEDFFSSLPMNLKVGLASLFSSIASMMVVFCSASFIVFNGEASWIPILISVLASIAVIIFIRKHYRLFVQAGHTF